MTKSQYFCVTFLQSYNTRCIKEQTFNSIICTCYTAGNEETDKRLLSLSGAGSWSVIQFHICRRTRQLLTRT